MRLELQAMTLAASDVPAMVAFYNGLFGAGLEPFTISGMTLYRGSLHGSTLIVCPNDLAGVVAEQNRHQLHYLTDDLPAALEAAAAAGGQVRDRTEHGATVIDPDGNTIVVSAKG